MIYLFFFLGQILAKMIWNGISVCLSTMKLQYNSQSYI